MKVISVINFKGGVGKTTLTTNIATQLSLQGKKVLAIDLDPQANLTYTFFNEDTWQERYQENKTIKAWYDSLLNKDKLLDLSNLIVKPIEVDYKTKGNLDIIGSHLGLINVESELAFELRGDSKRKYQSNFLKVHSLLSNGIKKLKNDYDIILIDCPPSFSLVTKNALVASDYYLVPAKLDYLSTLGIDTLNKHIHELTSEFNNYIKKNGIKDYNIITPKLLGVVCTMVSFKNKKLIGANEHHLSNLKRKGIHLFDTKIRENKNLYAGDAEERIPVVIKSSTNNTAKTVRKELEDLTIEFMEKVGL